MTREEAIQKLQYTKDCVTDIDDRETLSMAIEALKAEPKHGRWIRRKKLVPLPLDTEPLDYDDYDEETHSEWVPYWYCSECDYELGTFLSSDNYYCKCCGADMREAEREPTMEEYMCGQDLGSVEDGSL